MNCEEIQALLPDFWAGGLDEPSRRAVEAHLAGCRECEADDRLWSRLARVEEASPQPQSAERFRLMLAAFRQGMEQASAHAPSRRAALPGWLAEWWPARPAAWLALASACLLVGVFMGRLWSLAGAGGKELAQLHDELRSTRELVVVSLLQQQSAAERLRGVSWSERLREPDSDVLGALLTAVNHDPSVDVRLAAIDALGRYSSVPAVRQGLVDALGRTGDSPLVQITLIDSLVAMREARSVGVLERLRADEHANAAVRQRAGWAVRQF